MHISAYSLPFWEQPIPNFSFHPPWHMKSMGWTAGIPQEVPGRGGSREAACKEQHDGEGASLTILHTSDVLCWEQQDSADSISSSPLLLPPLDFRTEQKPADGLLVNSFSFHCAFPSLSLSSEGAPSKISAQLWGGSSLSYPLTERTRITFSVGYTTSIWDAILGFPFHILK